MAKSCEYLYICQPYITPKMRTARTGPIEASATNPKPSVVDVLPLIVDATPTPKARIKGTVIGPVVTPPASKEIGKNLLGVNKANRNINPYPANNKYIIGIFIIILSIANPTNIATPRATEYIIIFFEISPPDTRST